MIIFKEIAPLKDFLSNHKEIGFVPTMGALHDGHLTLMKESIKHSKLTVCSIFVNPTQFNDAKDFEKYPITLDKDIQLLEAVGVDVLFLPSVATLYPTGTENLEKYDLGELENLWEGAYRPGHFQGVCQVVSRLLDAVEPDQIFMGQKDFQQCMVIKKLLKLKNLSTKFVQVETVREPSGLAMSSRNMRLSPIEKVASVNISTALQYIESNINILPISVLKMEAEKKLIESGFKVDYVGIADAETLEPIDHLNADKSVVAMIAAYMNEVRLIDNMLVHKGLSY